MKLLVVDDSNVIRNKIARTLQVANVEVIGTARNGREAVAMFAKFRPELVTMDITMPEMDGLTAVERILRNNPKAIILIVSALADKSTAVEAIKRGAAGFLLKPISIESIQEALDDILSD